MPMVVLAIAMLMVVSILVSCRRSLSGVLVFNIVHTASRAGTRLIATAAFTMHRADVRRRVLRALLGFSTFRLCTGSGVVAVAGIAAASGEKSGQRDAEYHQFEIFHVERIFNK